VESEVGAEDDDENKPVRGTLDASSRHMPPQILFDFLRLGVPDAWVTARDVGLDFRVALGRGAKHSGGPNGDPN
jgi:hypothetical protein